MCVHCQHRYVVVFRRLGASSCILKPNASLNGSEHHPVGAYLHRHLGPQPRHRMLGDVDDPQHAAYDVTRDEDTLSLAKASRQRPRRRLQRIPGRRVHADGNLQCRKH